MPTQVRKVEEQTVFVQADRVNQALTAAIEKRALQWIARRAPQWLTSDQLTALGFAAQVATGLAYAGSRHARWPLGLAVLCIVLNWFGDSMDGTLARERRLQRPRYGFYVDHVADVVGATTLLIGVGLSGKIHWQISLLMLVAFLLLSAESYLATYTLSRFQLSQGPLGPTEIRLLLVAGTLALIRSPYATVLGRRYLLFDVGGLIATICMFLTVLHVSLRNIIRLYRQEPLP